MAVYLGSNQVNMRGGQVNSSSGGGGLLVTITTDDDGLSLCNKTVGEIITALETGVNIVFKHFYNSTPVDITYVSIGSIEYNTSSYSIRITLTSLYKNSSALTAVGLNSYPSYDSGGGGNN